MWDVGWRVGCAGVPIEIAEAEAVPYGMVDRYIPESYGRMYF